MSQLPSAPSGPALRADDRAWEDGRRRGRSVGDAARTSYYGTPVIHKPHWKWLIITYFFLGGLSGASYLVAGIADLFGGREGRAIARAGRYLSLAALLPSPLLLILDLGRPERFYNMLRVIKLRSPMSVGTWGLMTFGVFCTLSALTEAARDGLLGRDTVAARLLGAVPTRPLAALGTGPAFFVGGYTGVLLAATAVPLWTKNHLLLGPLFLTSALSNATAAIGLLLAMARGASDRTLARLERLDCLALIGELGLLLAMRANLGGKLARPMTRGHLGRVYRWGVLGLGIIAPLALQAAALARPAAGRSSTIPLAAPLVLAGGYLLRYVVVMAGRRSADDPHATFELAGDHGDGTL
jgi:formate-dependent nitrite reductase membrane component NrfD